jgi:sucrose-6-phosphate hydrolase SacC (GH32 family)
MKAMLCHNPFRGKKMKHKNMKTRSSFFYLPSFCGLLLTWFMLHPDGMAQDVHFIPRDHLLGDVHPFFHEGECYLYYLKPGKYESSLVRSRDLLHWTETPITHDPIMPDDWMSPYFVLGVFHDPSAKSFRSFYGHAQGRMASSVSHDLLHWSCAPKEIHVPAADYYQRRRDPYIFWIPEMKQYGCVMTTWMKGRPKETGGAVSLATSPDLKQWKDHGPILDPGTIGEPECPQMFQLGTSWYLLASIYDRAVGPPVYWISNSPLGPWKNQPDGILDGKDLCAAQIAFDGETPLLFGWIPLDPAKPEKQTWGGHLALPREVYARPDGKLGARLPAKRVKLFDKLSWQPKPGEWNRLVAEFRLKMPQGTKETRLSIAPLGEIVFKRDQIRILDATGECWSELHVDLDITQPVAVTVFIDGNIVELFIDQRHSLAARLPVSAGPVRFSAKSVAITSMRFSEWLTPLAKMPVADPIALWSNAQPVPKTADLTTLPGVEFRVIKPYEFNKDGYRFLHGVALCFHQGLLYASFGHNQGGENTDTEEARVCVSQDDGKTWGEVRTMDAGDGPVGVSHGAFLSHKGTLWAFHGAYTGTMKGVHTRAYVLDETTQQWQPKGTVIEGGFWPMQEPQKMEDGNWIMAGLKVGEGDPAVVAISHGEDFTHWDVVSIPQAKDLKKMWGESTIIVSGKQVTSLSRYGDGAVALVATSEDYGRTWGEMRPSNLPMTTSKPIAGTLSTGQRYLVCTTTADSGKRRSPLTIAVSRPGETLFSKVFVIRNAEFPDGPGESNKGAALSYPYAVEYDGKLYVGYSNSGDKSTRVGTGRELWNNNSAELAVIPVEKLKVNP